MTQLRRKRYQACEKELAGLPQHTLFDDAVTDAEAESFFRCSWYAAEEKRAALHSIESLRVRVLTELPASMALLTPEEHALMVRAVLFRGHMPLDRRELPGHGVQRAEAEAEAAQGVDHSGQSQILRRSGRVQAGG